MPRNSLLSQRFSVRFPVRSAVVVLAAAGLTLAGATAADAHVRVIPEATAGGAFTKLTFRVPNESDTASTTSVVVKLPTDTPLVFVSAQQLDGWTVAIAKTKLPKPVEVEGTTLTDAPSSVTWTAKKGNEIAPGQFQEFSLSGGPLPTGVKTLSFPAVQTYSDGTVVNWNQPQPEGADEPEHPVPSFDLTAALPAGADADAAPAPATAATAAAATAPAADDSDGLARAAGFGGLLLGLLGLVLGLLAWRRAGTRPTSPAGRPAGTPADGDGGSAAEGNTSSKAGTRA